MKTVCVDNLYGYLPRSYGILQDVLPVKIQYEVLLSRRFCWQVPEQCLSVLSFYLVFNANYDANAH